jgi:hypothetical protein
MALANSGRYDSASPLIYRLRPRNAFPCVIKALVNCKICVVHQSPTLLEFAFKSFRVGFQTGSHRNQLICQVLLQPTTHRKVLEML